MTRSDTTKSNTTKSAAAPKGDVTMTNTANTAANTQTVTLKMVCHDDRYALLSGAQRAGRAAAEGDTELTTSRAKYMGAVKAVWDFTMRPEIEVEMSRFYIEAYERARTVAARAAAHAAAVKAGQKAAIIPNAALSFQEHLRESGSVFIALALSGAGLAGMYFHNGAYILSVTSNTPNTSKSENAAKTVLKATHARVTLDEKNHVTLSWVARDVFTAAKADHVHDSFLARIVSLQAQGKKLTAKQSAYLSAFSNTQTANILPAKRMEPVAAD